MALPAEFLHLGGDVLVRRREIVGIFDLDNTSVYALAIDENGYVNNMAVCQFKDGDTPFNYVD